MPADTPQLSDILLGLSSGIENPYGNMFVRGADFIGVETQGRELLAPDTEKTNNLGYVGSGAGAEFMTERGSGYKIPPPIQIRGALNTNWHPILLRRAMGGADVVTNLEANRAWQHAFAMQLNSSAAGRQLPASSFIHALGHLDNVYGGGVVDVAEVSQEGTSEPQGSFTIIGSGRRERLSRILVANGFAQDFGTIPLIPPQNKMVGAETFCQFTDINPANGNPRVINLTNEKRLRFSRITLNNNHRTDLRTPGDPRFDPTTTRRGHYVSQMPHGDRTVTGEIRILMDALGREYNDAEEDIVITDFILRYQGHYIQVTGQALSLFQQTVEVKIPRAWFAAPRGGGDVDGELTLALDCGRDAVTLGAMTARIINGSSGPII